MKRLCIMRHAKSGWGEAVKDAERTLTERGRQCADFMADFMIKKGYVPEQVLCSTARRACLTLDPLKARLDEKVPIDYCDDLYMAMPDELLTHIRSISPQARTALLIGHNPGLGMLAELFADASSQEEAEQIAGHFPTAAFVVVDFDVPDWQSVKTGEGRIHLFTRPRELMESCSPRSSFHTQ